MIMILVQRCPATTSFNQGGVLWLKVDVKKFFASGFGQPLTTTFFCGSTIRPIWVKNSASQPFSTIYGSTISGEKIIFPFSLRAISYSSNLSAQHKMDAGNTIQGFLTKLSSEIPNSKPSWLYKHAECCNFFSKTAKFCTRSSKMP